MAYADRVEIQWGLPENCRQQAAVLYYKAFQEKFVPILGKESHAVAILEAAFNPAMALVALYAGDVGGMAGLQYGKKHFLDFKLRDFVSVYGWFRGLIRFALLLPLDHSHDSEMLFIDSLAVASTLRGKGIGSLLLETVFDFARVEGFRSVALEVVDTNPGARRLYERMGFVAFRTRAYPCLRRWLGFGAVTLMVKDVV